MHIRLFLISILIILTVFSTKGQEIDSCLLEKDSIADVLLTKRQSFPNWLVEQALENECCIGISDPYLDTDLALEQAKIRAVAIASLKEELAYRSIVDNYVSDKGGKYANTKFVSLTNMVSIADIDLKSIEVLKTYTSPFDEVFVLIKKPKFNTSDSLKDTTNTIKITADLLLSETKGRGEDSYNFIKFHIQNPDQYPIKKLNYYSYNTKSGKNIVSKINQFEIKFPSGMFRYQPYQAQDTIHYQNGFIEASLNYSFWNAYLDVILNNLLLMTKDGGEVKSLGDKYNQIFKNMFRVVDYQKMHFRISNLKVEGNRLYMKTTL